MIKLDENGKVVYTDPLEDTTEAIEEETLPASDEERIEALEKTAQVLSEELAAAKIILGVE